MSGTVSTCLTGLLTINVVRVDVLDGCTADVSRLSSESDPPQLVHAAQLETNTGINYPFTQT